MPEARQTLEERTKAFAVEVLRFVGSLPTTAAEQVLGRQLLRAGSAVGANYRAARRSRSRREFAARLAVVVEESDEAVYWLELLASVPTARDARLEPLLQEARELRAIFATALKTSKTRPRS
jgi:four helix bundle protein